MKIKLIDYLVKGKGVLTDILTRKSARILRGVDQAVDCAQDNADEERQKAEDILISLGESASSTDTEALTKKLNAYAEALNNAEEWEKRVGYFKKMKEDLNKEVEVIDD